MKALVCNKCGRVITNEESISGMFTLVLSTQLVGKFDEKHLCNACKALFYKWIISDMDFDDEEQ